MPERKPVPANWQEAALETQWVSLSAWCSHSVNAKFFSQAVSFPRSPTAFHTVSIMKLKLCTSALTPGWAALTSRALRFRLLPSRTGLGTGRDSIEDLLKVNSVRKES